MDGDLRNGDVAAAISSNSVQYEAREEAEEGCSLSDEDQMVYLVPFRWWKDAQDSSSTCLSQGIPYVATASSSYGGPLKLLNSFFNSDVAFNLKKEEGLLCNAKNGEVGVSSRDYALIPGGMWLQALKWHSELRNSEKETKGLPDLEDMSDVYPLQLRLSVIQETVALSVKISKKDNSCECFRRACKIFNMEMEPVRFWDFSRQTTLLLLNENNKYVEGAHKQTENELLLELQVYGLSDSIRIRGAKQDELGEYTNGFANGFSRTSSSNSLFSHGNSYESGTLGLMGLQNLGNTCFMNSALQCLVHTPKLVDYFLGDYRREINTANPLGMNGELASCFGDLLKKLWAPGATPLSPRTFKMKLAHFAPQFSGLNQHDSQEFLAFLLDGLHEDLNRVKHKPYFEAKDSDGHPDDEVADEYWRNHLARNNSVIVDVCQGQYRSTLVCPFCRKVSATFDPFMYLSLPLPSTSSRLMTLTVVSTEDNLSPSTYTVSVPKNGKLDDLTRSLRIACSLGDNETLLIAEVYNNCILRYLEEPTDALSLIRDADRLVAYRMPKDVGEAPLVVFMHQQIEEKCINGVPATNWRLFGVPLVVRKNLLTGTDIQEIYEKLLAPFVVPDEVGVKDKDGLESDKSEVAFESYGTCDSRFPQSASASGEAIVDLSHSGFCFYVTNEKGTDQGPEIVKDGMLNSIPLTGRCYVRVSWSPKNMKNYNLQNLSPLPVVSPRGFSNKRPEEFVSLYKCLEAFLKEEPLGPDDMWYCPVCKKHCQAAKKLDLWRLPEILVIHLKRFSFSRYFRSKLDTYVDFPIHDLDLSAYIARKDESISHQYMLYAISNHYGTLGSGHYTAFVRHDGNQWYDFDDSRVSPISEEKIKTSAAYVLFYRRVKKS